MTKQELLAVLDKSYDEQCVWCEKPEHGNRQMGQSLADLAFRLRDEVGEGRRFDDLNIEVEVYEYVIKSKGNKPISELFLSWWICHSTPIHWIIAALIAKEKDNG